MLDNHQFALAVLLPLLGQPLHGLGYGVGVPQRYSGGPLYPVLEDSELAVEAGTALPKAFNAVAVLVEDRNELGLGGDFPGGFARSAHGPSEAHSVAQWQNKFAEVCSDSSVSRCLSDE